MDIRDVTAVVTGASTGIGREVACAAAERGAQVALIGRNKVGLRETLRRVESSGGHARIYHCNLQEADAISEVAQLVLREMGNIGVIANVAGVWHDAAHAYYGLPLQDLSVSEIDEVMSVTIRAPMLLTRHLLPAMIAKRHGKILNISGTFALGGARWIHYYVAKLAVENFTIALADELREHEIQVNCISPSDVATEALKKYFPHDAKNALAPSDVASLAMYLLTDEVAHNITGQVLAIKSQHAYTPRT